MEVDYMVLADAAVVADGKHYIHGAGWSSLYAVTYPVLHPSMAAAVRLRVPWNATNRPHTLEIDVLDSAGNSIFPQPPEPPSGSVTVGRPPHLHPGADQFVCLSFNLVGLQFPRPGAYVVQLRLDGFDSAHTTFNVEPPHGVEAQIAP